MIDYLSVIREGWRQDSEGFGARANRRRGLRRGFEPHSRLGPRVGLLFLSETGTWSHIGTLPTLAYPCQLRIRMYNLVRPDTYLLSLISPTAIALPPAPVHSLQTPLPYFLLLPLSAYAWASHAPFVPPSSRSLEFQGKLAITCLLMAGYRPSGQCPTDEPQPLLPRGTLPKQLLYLRGGSPVPIDSPDVSGPHRRHAFRGRSSNRIR